MIGRGRERGKEKQIGGGGGGGPRGGKKQLANASSPSYGAVRARWPDSKPSGTSSPPTPLRSGFPTPPPPSRAPPPRLSNPSPPSDSFPPRKACPGALGKV
ncbi:hypothetical protein L209DRAFT_533113 [Thermothelomyces heterothallicus CBS 203.75]